MDLENNNDELFFNIAQTFFVDKDFFNDSEDIQLIKVDLYFKQKPARRNNKSGIVAPSVTLMVTPVRQDGVPDFTKRVENSIVKVDYDEIVSSDDASSPTTFQFDSLIRADTDMSYALVISYEGNEDYELWTSKEGDILVGTNTKTAGPAGQYIGKYFEYAAIIPMDDFASGSVRLTPLNNTDLKFDVYCAKFISTGNTTVTNTVTGGNTIINQVANVHILQSQRYEYFIYDETVSTNTRNIDGSVYVFQNSVNQTGTLVVNQHSRVVNGAGGVNFNTLYDLSSNAAQYIIMKTGNANQPYMVREIISIESNTQIIIDKPSRFTNTAANFIRSAVGLKALNDKSVAFGRRRDFLVLKKSNANSTLRFTNNCVEAYAVTVGGSSFVNGNIMTVTAVTPFSMNAIATVTTNATGGLTTLTFSNNGCGINSNPVYTFANSTGGATGVGTGATVTFTIGASLLTEANITFGNTTLINYDFHGHRWSGHGIHHSQQSGHQARHSWRYSHSGNTYVINYQNTRNNRLINRLDKRDLATKSTPLMVSLSYRVLDANADTIDSTIEINVSSNSVFSYPDIPGQDMYIYKNLVNNDYTGENTRYGNAIAKHISSKINFEDERFAEDLNVYLRAYRPANTDIKVFAKIHNSKDPESFDDKDWTLLDCISGGNTYSSATDTEDLIEYTYSFAQSPNSAFTSNGTMTTVLNQSNVTGSNTTFSTDFAANDMVKLYPPLFPENYMIAVVNAVTNNTLLSLKSVVSNTGIVGTGLRMDKITFKKQAFNYVLNGNVVRYYATNMTEYDTYDTFSLKIVMLSADPAIVPMIDDTRGVGISA